MALDVKPGDGYPAHREADVVGRDGRVVHVRPARPNDEDAILALLSSLSPVSRALRFFSGATDLAREARRAVEVDHRASHSLVVEVAGQIVAQAPYDEDALVVAALNLDQIREVREAWQFYRDRRPETYTNLLNSA